MIAVVGDASLEAVAVRDTGLVGVRARDVRGAEAEVDGVIRAVAEVVRAAVAQTARLLVDRDHRGARIERAQPDAAAEVIRHACLEQQPARER